LSIASKEKPIGLVVPSFKQGEKYVYFFVESNTVLKQISCNWRHSIIMHNGQLFDHVVNSRNSSVAYLYRPRWICIRTLQAQVPYVSRIVFCSVLFFSRPRSEGWPHHGRTFSICPYPLSFRLTLPRRVLSTSRCCPPRPRVVFLACVHLVLFLALSLSSGNSLFPHGVTIVC